MEIGIWVRRKIVVDSEIDTLNIDTTTKDIGGNANSLVELLELLISCNSEDKVRILMGKILITDEV